MLEDSAFQWCDYAPHGMFNMKQFELKTLQTNYGPSILLIVIEIFFSYQFEICAIAHYQ
jgi:hypothetical protein